MENSAVREDGVTRTGDLEQELEQDEIEDEIEEEEPSVSYPRGASGDCINPCPHFSCLLDKDTCDSNCERCLENPCLICGHECEAAQKRVLLKPDVRKYKRLFGGQNMDAIYKDNVAKRRKDLMDKREQIQDELEDIKLDAKKSILPDSVAMLLKKNKIKELSNLKESIDNKLDEQIKLFEYS